jgi:hypothetical protein
MGLGWKLLCWHGCNSFIQRLERIAIAQFDAAMELKKTLDKFPIRARACCSMSRVQMYLA